MAKNYFRMSVNRLKGKRTEHTVEFTSERRSDPHESVELIVRPDHTVVDEVVIDDWFHLEAQSSRSYWMNIAGVVVWVYMDKGGSVSGVDVYEAGEYDEPRDGVKYRVTASSTDTRRSRAT